MLALVFEVDRHAGGAEGLGAGASDNAAGCAPASASVVRAPISAIRIPASVGLYDWFLAAISTAQGR
jgi:hypothetical protein